MYYEEEFRYEYGSRDRRRKPKCLNWEEDLLHDDCGCGFESTRHRDIRPAREESRHRHDDKHDRHERGGHMHKHDSCCCKRDNCKGCICNQFKHLNRNQVVLFSTGDAIQLLTAVFISFDQKTCCATLRLGTKDIFVDCRDIKVLLVV